MARFVRVVPVEGETLGAALIRARTWAGAVAVPPGVEIAFGSWEEFDPDEGPPEQGGWRTYLLTGKTVISEHDIVDAMARKQTDPYSTGGAFVSIELGPQGADRFAEATRAWTKRRIAIVVDQVVMSAPVVQSEIRGGSLQITMGAGDPEQRLAEAHRLAAALVGGRQRRPD